jgi:hypothetical protein
VNVLFDHWDKAENEGKVVWQVMLDHSQAKVR